jgi:hypothetical protein
VEIWKYIGGLTTRYMLEELKEKLWAMGHACRNCLDKIKVEMVKIEGERNSMKKKFIILLYFLLCFVNLSRIF